MRSPEPGFRGRGILRDMSKPASAFVDDVFGEGGIFDRAIPGYQVREPQVEVSRAIAEAMHDGKTLLAEAGTGVGKSYGYGVPASWWAAKENDGRDALGLPRQVAVIVTANIALQEQLVGKDFPRMQELLPWQFSFALAKGRQNYLCIDRFEEAAVERSLIADPIVRQQSSTVEQWATKTTTGDLSELPFELEPRLRRLLVVGQDECTHKSCPSYAACWAEQAKNKAKNADVVITNYHMFFIDLSLRIETEGEAHLLPDHSIVVFDEAHKAADIAREFFGFRVTRGQIINAARLLWAEATPRKEEVHIDASLKRDLGEKAADFFTALDRYEKSDDYATRLTDPEPVTWRPLMETLRRARDVYARTVARGGLSAARKEEIMSAARRCTELANSIGLAMTIRAEVDGSPAVYFLERSGSGVALVMKLLDVSDKLEKHVFASPRLRSVTATSATLTTSGNFDYVSMELGAYSAEECLVESPFDFAKQAVLVIPDDMPMPTDQRFAQAVAQRMVEVAEISDGGMLGLFTSYRVLDIAHRYFMERGWADRVMRQGEAPRTQLVQRLRDEPGSVLLGTESFWAGVDVPGQSLGVVVIDKLPFPSPDDPMLSAYESLHGSKTFKEYSMPRAIMALRQGFGRLIRSVDDVGAVVILDRRLTEKPYGRSFLKSLPKGLKRSDDLADVARILGRPAPRPRAAGAGR